MVVLWKATVSADPAFRVGAVIANAIHNATGARITTPPRLRPNCW
jgi:hypothetical protein